MSDVSAADILSRSSVGHQQVFQNMNHQVYNCTPILADWLKLLLENPDCTLVYVKRVFLRNSRQ